MAHRMNHDTWSEVFIASVEEDPSALVTLRSVSRAWFYITGRTIQLWTTIVLDRRRHFTDLEYLFLYLQKSGIRPLDVYINMKHIPPFQVEDEQMYAVANILREQVSRLRILSIQLSSELVESANTWILSIGGELPAPLLERMILKIDFSFDRASLTSPSLTSLSTAFTPSPKLAHLEFGETGLRILKNHESRQLPHLSTLTSLVFEGTHTTILYDVKVISETLRSTPNLQRFVYKAHGRPFLEQTSLVSSGGKDISLPCLLTADVSAHGVGIHVMPLFDAPLLEVVRLDGYSEYYLGTGMRWPWEDAALLHKSEVISTALRHLARISPNLQRLELTYARPRDVYGDHRRIFSGEWFPNLEELVLVSTWVTDDALTIGSGWFIHGRSRDFVLSLYVCHGLTKSNIELLATIVKVKEYSDVLGY